MSLSRILGAVAAFALCGAVAPSAFAWNPIDGSRPVWKSFPVQYKVNQQSLPASIASIGVARVDAGFASWMAPDCTSLTLQNTGDTNLLDNASDGQNIIRWQSGTWKSSYGPVESVIGVTLPVFGQGKIIDADIIFNNVGFSWNDTGSSGGVDTQSIATHEQGHFLGLDHSQTQSATMYAAYSGGSALRSLDQDDINGICTLYPQGSTSGSGTSSSSSSTGSGVDPQACNDCMNTSINQGGACQSQGQACFTNQDCANLVNCANACQTQACVQGCATQYPAGVSGYNGMLECALGACDVECNGTSGTSSSSSSSTGAGGADASTTATSVGVGGAGGGGVVTTPSDDDDVRPESGPGCSCRVAGEGSSRSSLPGTLVAIAGVGLYLSRRRRS